MKFPVNKEQIIDGLQKAATILPAKAGAAYLRSIWLKAENNELSIMATDANLEFTGKYPVEIVEPGLIGVQGRAFVDLARQLPTGVILFSVDDKTNALLLKQGKRSYKLPINSAEWFQEFSPFPDETPVGWTGDVLLDIIDKVSFCICDDDSQDALSCLYFHPRGKGAALDDRGDIDICGLNTHQFAMVTIKNDDLCNCLPDAGLLIQRKYVQDMKKWLGPDEIELNLSDKRLFIKRMNTAEMFSLPLALNYDFPDYNVFLSKLKSDDISKLTINRKETIEALSRIAVFNTPSDRCVYMSLKETEVTFYAEGADIGSASETLDAEYSGNIQNMVFPTKNLIEIFNHFGSEKIEMLFTNEDGPCGIKGAEDPGYTVVIMPMKVAERTYYQEEEI